MTSPTGILANYAAGLAFEQIPEPVRECAVDGIVDTVGACMFGATLPWSRAVIDYASSADGHATVIGTPHRVTPAFAALANGTMAHGCEIDNLRQPSVGVHPGAVLVPAALAIGEEIGASGKDLLTAYVAGFEVMARIGISAHNTSEQIGFHGPALTGTFGAAIAAGRLLRLDPSQMTNALGIAGSFCSGILAFAKAGNGGTVKRLHMGRAAEGGVLAARLAQSGFEGPDVVIEGKFGFLDCFARDPNLPALTKGLGETWETLKTCFKRYAAHVTAHTPIQAFEELRARETFTASDIGEVHLATSEKVLSHHASTTPKDIASAQYSVPICLAVAACRDPNNPASFLADPHKDDAVLTLSKKIILSLNPDVAATGHDWATTLTVVLKNGQKLSISRHDFIGAPSNPMPRADIERKFMQLAGSRGEAPLAALKKLTDVKNVRSIFGTSVL